jgi:predicted DNA-binding mobile mystery protein A
MTGYSLTQYRTNAGHDLPEQSMAWDRKLLKARESLDGRLAPLHPASQYRPPARGWIRALRDALGMSADQLGKLMSVRRQSIADMELSEAKGSITLDTLRRAATAMDCTLVYALVPNSSLQATIETRARTLAHTALAATAHTMALEDQAVATTSEDMEAYIRDHISERQLWSAE